MPRVLVAAVPRRRAACSARTLWCTSGPTKRSPKAASSSLTFFVPPRIGASAICAHLHDAARRTRDRASYEQQVLLGVHLDYLEALLGDALVAHLAGSADALHHAGGPGGGADRSGRADVVRAVRLGAAGEVVALDRALEALALGDAGDLHPRARLEGLDGDRLAQHQLAGLATELDDRLHRRRVGLLEMTELGFGEVLLLGLVEGQLDGFVAVAVERADRRHRAGAGLEHRHARDASVFLEELCHTELLGEDRRHLVQGVGRPQVARRISMSTPAGR